MLEVLKIKNFAIIDSAEIRFTDGLNVLSGETGAGKSIVIEAISLLLGSRANCESIRANCAEALIEGLFSIAEIPWMTARLQEVGISADETESLLIKRVIHQKGRHRIYINGELATLGNLQKVCEGLVDLCGQHEHQLLLRSSKQLEILDQFGDLTNPAKAYAETWNQVRSLLQEKKELESVDIERTKRADFLKFQMDEIRAADLLPEEDERLLQEKQLLQSAEGRAQAAEAVRRLLEAEEEGALERLKAALLKLRSLQSLDERVQPLMEALERAVFEAEEVAIEINRYLNGIDVDSEKLQGIQDRLALIAGLRRKYGGSVAEILKTLALLEGEYASIEQAGDRLNQLEKELEDRLAQLQKQGFLLSSGRRKSAEKLSKLVSKELGDLKMGDARFTVEAKQKEDSSQWTSSGADSIQFLVQTNRGEPARPLAKIASGGELSRLTLAIRRVITDRGADRGGIGVYLFDEIDSGIGGQTAFQVGKKLKSVARYSQVICITHLPQVASFADHHLVVRKSIVGKRTQTLVSELDRNQRKQELARMLGSPVLTRKTLENASELLDLAQGQG